jgi:lysyl-tRNA synthetase class 2
MNKDGCTGKALALKDKSTLSLSQLRPCLEGRAAILDAVRAFFRSHGFLEVDTPVRVLAPAPESHIDAIPAGGAFLRTSPELEMKRLLAAGYPRIFQVGPCFRAGERGRIHREEFTMLEWYQADADYRALIPFTRDLLIHAAGAVESSGRAAAARFGLAKPWMEITVRDAFANFAHGSLEEALQANRYEETLVGEVEPRLPRDVPVALLDYPADLAAFARLRADDPTLAERWEVYVGGVELANAYSELTDPAEYRRRFAKFAEDRRVRGGEDYPEAASFHAAMIDGMPASAGCALGLDRLVMLLLDAAGIDDIAFPAE